MGVQFTVLSFILFSAALLTLGAAVYGYRHREVPGAKAFVALMILIAYWSVAYGTQLLYTSLKQQLLWDSVQYLGGFLAPIVFLVFVLRYTDRQQLLTRSRLALLSVLPLAASMAVWIPDLRWLVRTGASLTQINGFAIANISHGPLFLLTLGYTYVLVVAGLGLLIATTFQTANIYRQQTALITVGAVVPIVGSVVTYLLGLTIIDLTPVALAVFGVVFAVALYRYRLLDVLPIARTEVVEQVNDGIVVTDQNDRIVDINSAARDVLDVDDVIGAELSMLDTAPVDELRNTSLESTTEISPERESQRYFSCQKETITDSKRTTRGYLYILHEVTERRAREQWFRSLTEDSSDIICVLNGQLEVTYVSPSISRVLGYQPGELVGRDLLELVETEDRSHVGEILCNTKDRQTKVTFHAKSADGAVRILQSKNRNRLTDPVVDGIVLNIRDVTESRAREQELEKKNKRLDAFAGVVSHDLRNPLNVAMARTEFLAAELAEPEAQEHLSPLSDSLERMESIIEETLLLARRGETITGMEWIEINELATHCWTMVETAASSLDVVDEFSFHGDRERLEHVFENLFRNAVEHGGKEVTIRIGLIDDGGFYIEDDGSGIPEDVRDDVFDIGETTSAGGTGLGLAITKRIVEAHEWEVDVTTSSGGGARFEFTGVDTQTLSNGELEDKME